jgi:hypothetical protein
VFQAVFTISDQYPDGMVGAGAAIGLLSLGLAFLRGRSRRLAIRHSGVLLAFVGVVVGGYLIHTTGGPAGLRFGAAAGGPMILLGVFVAIAGPEEPFPLGRDARNYYFALVALVGGLGTLAFLGLPQLQAFDLQRQLDQGAATLISGKVEQLKVNSWSYECFTVSGHRLCYDNGSAPVGFHQSSSNGGPIHEGLDVRVWYIGDTIVRLDVAEPAQIVSTGSGLSSPIRDPLVDAVLVVLTCLAALQSWWYFVQVRRARGPRISTSPVGLVRAFFESGQMVRANFLKRETDRHLERLRLATYAVIGVWCVVAVLWIVLGLRRA